MGVRAINYCTDKKKDKLTALQILVGHPGTEVSQWVALRKHGGSGGECRRWTLLEDDYIRDIQYTWDIYTFQMSQVVFKTHLKQVRVFGREDDGMKINFEYSAFQPFVGIISYEKLD